MFKRNTVSLMIENLDGQLLLMLRDDNPSLDFPNCWSFIGGEIEEGESPEEAMAREAMEELEFDFGTFRFFKIFVIESIKSHVFYVQGNYNLNIFNLREGQAIQFISEGQFDKLKIAYGNEKIICEYLENRAHLTQ